MSRTSAQSAPPVVSIRMQAGRQAGRWQMSTCAERGGGTWLHCAESGALTVGETAGHVRTHITHTNNTHITHSHTRMHAHTRTSTCTHLKAMVQEVVHSSTQPSGPWRATWRAADCQQRRKLVVAVGPGVHPTQHLQHGAAERPDVSLAPCAGGREGGWEGVPCLYGWSRETHNTYHDCYRHHHQQQQQQQC